MQMSSLDYAASTAQGAGECRRIWLRERADGPAADRAEAFLNEIRKDRLRERSRQRSPLRRLFRKLGTAIMGIAAYGVFLAAFYQIAALT